jgi:two-component sensor histidine kinase
MLTMQRVGEEGLEVREANHRMLNTLTMLQAVFRHKFSAFNDQSVRSAMTEFDGQIIAAAELFRAISSVPANGYIAVDAYLEHLSRALSKAILSPADIGCEVFSHQGRLPADLCGRLGFIVTELVLNASKYAFAGRRDGLIRIEMTRSGDKWCCTVSDNGIGMNEANGGTGLNIVRELARSLNGRMILRSGATGTSACVILPDPTITFQRNLAGAATTEIAGRGDEHTGGNGVPDDFGRQGPRRAQLPTEISVRASMSRARSTRFVMR